MLAKPKTPMGPRTRSAAALPPISLVDSPSKPLVLSPSDTPRFHVPVPTLNIPFPRTKSAPIKLKIVAPHEEKTIHPEQTYSPRMATGSVPPAVPAPVDPLTDLVSAVNRASIASTSASAPPPPVPSNHAPSRSPERPVIPSSSKHFSDEDLVVLLRIGEGAGGAVHKVKDTRDGAIYARKTITAREVPMRQVVRELNVISTTSHVNIVQSFGAYIGPSSSEVMIVMEHCDGGSLEAVGKKIKQVGAVVGEKIAGRIAEGVLQGLAYLHSRRTIHRDIKPSNILLSREGIVKLCDFGVSGELVDSRVGTFTGTFIYMAPERVSGGEYTVRSDVWSTGISLLELVQNRFPFPTDLPMIDLIVTITKGDPPKLEDMPEVGVTWRDEMKDFIRQTLIPDPSTRPTPREMLAHPWIVWTMKQEAPLARWIAEVWGWPTPPRRARSARAAGAGGGGGSP